jgi:HD-GYP domain-containing protein (c-di-GMP phosphodiesterase class II)
MSMSLGPTIDAFQRAVRVKDAYTAGHNQRVSQYAKNLAQAVGLSADSICAIAIGGQLHDVGKIGVADAILQKPSRLTRGEFLEVQRHSALGHHICEPLGLNRLILDIVRSHHERLDGSGYPDGLRGSLIPVEVQIVAIADIIDALITHRVYKKAYSVENAWDILYDEASRGLHDVSLVNECIRLMANGDFFCTSLDSKEAPHSLSDHGHAALAFPEAGRTRLGRRS